MTPTESDRFLDTLKHAPESFYNMLSRVSAQKSESFNARDKELIFEAVVSTVGFTQLDSMIFRVFERCGGEKKKGGGERREREGETVSL